MRSPGTTRKRILRLLRSALFLLYPLAVGGGLTEICLRLGFPRTETFERARWACVDLLPEFRRHSAESLYIERDSRWNAGGEPARSPCFATRSWRGT